MINPSSTKREILDVFMRMAIMAEIQNPSIRSHLERVRGYTYILASNIEETRADAEDIAIGSVLHDIGKVGLPSDTNIKSEAYTPAEFEAIKKHVPIGAQILNGSPVSLVRVAQTILLSHHERWDGSGYPDGLRANEIPLTGRIFAVADVFDALTTYRAYKQTVTVMQATQMIQESAGILFDERVVHAFTARMNEILNVRQNYL